MSLSASITGLLASLSLIIAIGAQNAFDGHAAGRDLDPISG